jgi:hypothetical protein
MKAAPLYKVPVGARLVLDDVSWTVIGADKNGYAVEGLFDGEVTNFGIDWVQNAIAQNRCEVIKPAQLQKTKELLKFTGGYEREEQLPKEERVNIRARLALDAAAEKIESEGHKMTQRFLSRPDIITRLERMACEIAQEPNLFHISQVGSTRTPYDIPKGRTLSEMIARFKYFDRNPVALMHRHHLKGPPEHLRSRLCHWQEKFIDFVLNSAMNFSKPKLKPLFDLAKGSFEVPEDAFIRGFEFPSIVTVRTRWAAISKLVKTIGQNGSKFAANAQGAGSTDVRALFYGERGAMDQVYLSIFTNGKGDIVAEEIDPKKEGEELKPNEIRRLWMSFMLDVATRLPLAWVLSESADTDHTMALLRMATRDKTKEKERYGCLGTPAPPVNLMLTTADNGPATRAKNVYASQLGAGMSVVTSRTYNSTDNPNVERVFGTFQFQVLVFEKGYNGSRPGDLPGAEPMKEANISLDRLYEVITGYFIDEYPNKAHDGTGMFGATPNAKYRKTKKLYGAIDPPSPETRRRHLGMKKELSTTSEGILFNKIPYNSTELQSFHDGKAKKVTVFLDPDYLQRVTITAEGIEGIMHADLRMSALRDQTLYEAQDLMLAAVHDDPLLKEIDDAVLRKAIKRRSKESGFFSDSRDPASYGKTEYLEKKAAQLANVEVRPTGTQGATVRPGNIMDRSNHPTAYKTKRVAETVMDHPTKPATDKPKSGAGRIYAPIKKSKL